jgi:predicted dehydrogenase
MKTNQMLSRRSFLRRSAAITSAVMAAPLVVPSSILRAQGQVPPGNRITLGFIGVGDHGLNRNINGLIRYNDAQIVAVCDVDSVRLERAKQFVENRYSGDLKQGAYKGCAAYNDFRELLARTDIDAVVISTPDHWHVIPAIMAVQSDKDVICEKPLSLTVKEGRVLSDACKKHNRIFQTASENRSQEISHYHRMVELVRNGRIGRLKSIRVELPTGYSIRAASSEFGPPPDGFDYDMWLGQAPWAPYCEARCHWNFRWNLAYSGGMLTDWGAHLIDIAQWANDTEHSGPIDVEGEGDWPPRTDLFNAARKWDLWYTYANGVRMNVVSHRPGIIFEGTEGKLWNEGWAAAPKSEPASILTSEIKPGELHLYTAPNEHRNFLDCVKSRKPCYAPAEIGHRTISIAHIGNIAMMMGRKLRWDPAKEQFLNDAEANKLLDYPRRDPWQLPKV